ncbi:MAG TPA: hotdog domain-containing protein [Acidimicrobiales bacterium]|nr:hotdog domain-containing protein [Acidimicrobiales bacterium]
MTALAGGPEAAGDAHLAEVVFPGQLNHHGTYFAGAALGLMSRAALVAARRTARGDVVMAACERSEFRSPIYAGELVEATARVERVGRRSMTVAVEMVAEVLTTGERRRAAFGQFEMVSVDGAPSVPDGGSADGDEADLFGRVP